MRIFVWLIVTMLAACSTGPTQRAPVIERLPQSIKKPAPAPTPAQKTPSTAPAAIPGTEKDWRPEAYTVKKGDTLYSIGLEFGYDYKELAQRNNISPPYVIYVGQSLKLKGIAPTAAVAEPAPLGPAVVTPMKTEQAVTAKSLNEPPLKTEPKATKEPYSAQAMIVQPPQPAETVIAKAEAPKTPEAAKIEPTKPEAAKAETTKSEAAAETSTTATARGSCLSRGSPPSAIEPPSKRDRSESGI